MKQKYYIDHMFNKWLKKNIDRFIYKPIKVKNGVYKFEGITDDIILRLNGRGMRFYEAEIAYSYNNCIVDLLDLAILMQINYDKKRKQYYDYSYIKPVYYDTLEKLVYNEVFERILKYSNITLRYNKYLYLFTSSDHSELIVSSAIVGGFGKQYRLKPFKLIVTKSFKARFGAYRKNIHINST